MPQAVEKSQTLDQLQELNRALNSGTFSSVRQMLRTLPAGDIAHLLESSPPPSRHVLWQLIEEADEGEVLQELGDDLQAQFLRSMEPQEVATAMEGLEPDDVADILQQLPDKVLQNVLTVMDYQDRARVEHVGHPRHVLRHGVPPGRRRAGGPSRRAGGHG